MSSFGERLKSEREKKGYNQKEFAEAIDVTPTRLNYWEKDKREPDFINIRKMIDVLGCDADYLLGTKCAECREETSGVLTHNESILLKSFRSLNAAEQRRALETLGELEQIERYHVEFSKEFDIQEDMIKTLKELSAMPTAKLTKQK